MPTLTLIPYTITLGEPSDDGGSEINKYQLRLSIHGGGYSEWIDLNSTDPRLVALLPADVEMTVEFRAVNDVGPGEIGVFKIRPVREPGSDDEKKIGDGSINIHLPDPSQIGIREPKVNIRGPKMKIRIIR